jgi:hypothetical protein
MKRTLAALLMLLLLIPAQPPAQAVQTREQWDEARTLRANLTVPALVDLEIGPGVNISFEPDQNASEFSSIRLTVAGGFEVCGTADRPVALFASNESIYTHGTMAGALNIDGNGDAGQVLVQNCSFRNLIVVLNETGGRFQDCVFESSYIYIQDSAMMFENCSFLRSAASIYSIATLNQTRISRCRFDSLNQGRWDPFWEYFDQVSAVKVSGYVSIDNCTISGYGTGIESSSGLPVITGCLVEDCHAGISLETTDPADTPRVEGCIVQDCIYYGLVAQGNLLLRNCTLNGSPYGLLLYNTDPETVPNWTLSGNRIFGNEYYGIVLSGEEVILGDTRFDDGAGRTNGQGRIIKTGDLTVFVVTRGSVVLSDLYVNVTDATGNWTANHRLNSMWTTFSDMTEYLIDNSGKRTDNYPYTVRAEWNGIFSETTVSAGTRNVTLVLEVLPDLVPFEMTLDPPSPRAGDYLAITCTVNNTGPRPSSRVTALFTLDGERLDESELFTVSAGSFSFVRALDWKAHRGTHSVTVQLDPQNALEENDESNNNLTFNFTVGEARPRPVSAPDIGYAGAATVVILVLACAGCVLVLRRRNRAKEA